jgi:hypothetical protein
VGGRSFICIACALAAGAYLAAVDGGVEEEQWRLDVGRGVLRHDAAPSLDATGVSVNGGGGTSAGVSVNGGGGTSAPLLARRCNQRTAPAGVKRVMMRGL